MKIIGGGFALLIIGLYLFYSAWNSHQDALTSSQGIKVTGKVISCETDNVGRDPTYRSSSEINFRTKEGQEFVIIDNSYHEIGALVTVSYDPSNPSSAVIPRPMTYSFYVIIYIILGLISFLSGFFTLLISVSEGIANFFKAKAYKSLKVEEENGKFGFVNRKGKVIIPILYDSVNNFQEGLAMVKLETKYGFINKNGKEVIPIIYDSVKKIGEKYILASLEQKFGLINNKGKIIIPVLYDSVSNFQEGQSLVKRGLSMDM